MVLAVWWTGIERSTGLRGWVEFWVCKGWSKKGLWIKGVLSSQFLITHSRLGELYFAYVNNLLSIMILSPNWFLFDWENSYLMCCDWELEYLRLGAWLCIGNVLWDEGFDISVYWWLYVRMWLSICVKSMVLSATCHYNCIGMIECLVVYFWVWFGIILGKSCVSQRGNSASLAQASLSRLSESCRTSFQVWFTLLAQATWFSVERLLVSLRREWLA